MFGGVPIAESVVVTWVIMAVLLVLSLILVRNLKVENPGKKQLLLESGVSFLLNFFEGILGEEGKRYIPYLMSTVIYIGIANIAGVFGFTPPTKDMNVTIALSLMSIILIEYSGFHKRGLKGFLHSFAEPVPIMLPINILELAIRPTSLCMRLFGNVLGSFVVMKLLEFICPAILPIPFSLYFDFFDVLAQELHLKIIIREQMVEQSPIKTVMLYCMVVQLQEIPVLKVAVFTPIQALMYRVL